jgi:hypothetical protein
VSDVTPPAVPAGTPATPRWTDPDRLLYRAPASRTIRTVAIAVAIAWAIKLATELIWLIRRFIWTIDDGPGDIPDAFRDFADDGILDPLLFFVAAGALLVLVLPILPETPLLRVLMRVAVAGVGGFVLLSIKGLITAIGNNLDGFYFGYFLNSWIGLPLLIAIELTTLLAVGAAVSWALANRKKAAK